MNTDVYDTYATYSNGETVHFDVLLPKGSTHQKAVQIAKQWLKELGGTNEIAQLSSSRFCHSEAATPEVYSEIKNKGFAILQL